MIVRLKVLRDGWLGWGILGLAVVALCAACGPGGFGGNKYRVTMICDVGGLGDQGFNDSGWRGVQMAADLDPSIEPKIIQSREQADYIGNLSQAAESSGVVVSLGFLMLDSAESVAKEYPEVSFIHVDGVFDAPNVAAFDFKAQEGAFLAGILAADASETGVVAVMPGMDIPPVLAFATGYRAGVAYMGQILKRDIQVLSTTIGAFNDPVKAKAIAEGLIAKDADVILQLAGQSGLGVLEAVKEAPGRRFMIGVDIDQDDLAPGKVLTSVIKRIDKVVADQIAAAKSGGLQHGEHFVGLAEEAVGLTEMRHTRDAVQPLVHHIVASASSEIIKGNIVPPKTYDELEAFLKEGGYQ